MRDSIFNHRDRHVDPRASPSLAVRVLLDRNGHVAKRSSNAIRKLLSDPSLELRPKILETITHAATTLVWANIATGQEPDIDGAITLTDTLIDACVHDRSR